MNNTVCGRFKQAIGRLVEDYVLEKYGLFYNRRQYKRGYYDAYDGERLYEIKAMMYSNDSKLVINKLNHKKLLTQQGIYIVVLYTLKDKSKGLSIISDIVIVDEIVISAESIIPLLRYQTTINETGKTYFRVKINDLLEWNKL